MLPPLNDHGYLPAGIHLADLAEVVETFGSGSPEREVETQELIDFVNWARQADITRLLVNGSYVTAKIAPNDVDVVILPDKDYPSGESSVSHNASRWPFLQVFIAVNETDFEMWAKDDFGTDRTMLKKGVVEVVL